MPTQSPLPLLGSILPPLPKLVGPLNPLKKVNVRRVVVPVTIALYGWLQYGSPRVPLARELKPVNDMLAPPRRHNVGPHLLQRYGVSFGGPDGEERA